MSGIITPELLSRSCLFLGGSLPTLRFGASVKRETGYAVGRREEPEHFPQMSGLPTFRPSETVSVKTCAFAGTKCDGRTDSFRLARHSGRINTQLHQISRHLLNASGVKGRPGHLAFATAR